MSRSYPALSAKAKFLAAVTYQARSPTGFMILFVGQQVAPSRSCRTQPSLDRMSLVDFSIKGKRAGMMHPKNNVYSGIFSSRLGKLTIASIVFKTNSVIGRRLAVGYIKTADVQGGNQLKDLSSQVINILNIQVILYTNKIG